jgi:hypothetical protein
MTSPEDRKNYKSRKRNHNRKMGKILEISYKNRYGKGQ